MSAWQGLEPHDLLYMVEEGMVTAKDVAGEYAYEMCKKCTSEECADAISKQTGEEFDANNFWQRVVNHLIRKVGSKDRSPQGPLRTAIDALQAERIANGLTVSEGRKKK
ncbi:hypothetical protein CLAFUW4_02440 [Fulvia fulva]|uniref:Uncharacterized protein n=1 Tax=Passalora fulva TaxID=5499 RepID=A0A9Q8L9N9_PASFU|nr:uncharacterized protein CLAFUR5_02430 [Fulvia fulva]KAK4632242.1 hypothetical protein CLAFUR4_02435 [Fulvia fulva]KAK4633207.1 hypothetical protein CLAFUR0_02439 [Fulvia fulva]UJO13490.1 hypothetical protein CLAFUR5_02430 [Fulvia fulva]WPV11667.1 hypothetical protein CLAFUW4_02440 [Fulvia fulva]WPV26504.1 hypothetical protein CLAFUW7_02440 [Fulvia fulva]